MDAMRNLLNIEMSSELSEAFYSLRLVDERCRYRKLLELFVTYSTGVHTWRANFTEFLMKKRDAPTVKANGQDAH
jgi:hypothetical protein